ncbi:antitoxin [Streptomyces sp. NPDC005423]|uniref:antitoxin n=1 Tax=Streptomyces sp. NPDC005423 TaxID=3155343 RepID=UPI0033B13E31
MGMMDKLKHMMKGHEDQAGQGVDKAGDYVDKKTQNKHSRQVDSAQEQLRRQMGDDPGHENRP